MVVLLRSLSQFISDGHRSPLSSDHSLSIVTGSDGDLKAKGGPVYAQVLTTSDGALETGAVEQ